MRKGVPLNFGNKKDCQTTIMTIVRAQDGESVDSLIRKFNKKVQADGILTELKKREFYEKPSTIRKRENALKRHSKPRDY